MLGERDLGRPQALPATMAISVITLGELRAGRVVHTLDKRQAALAQVAGVPLGTTA